MLIDKINDLIEKIKLWEGEETESVYSYARTEAFILVRKNLEDIIREQSCKICGTHLGPFKLINEDGIDEAYGCKECYWRDIESILD